MRFYFATASAPQRKACRHGSIPKDTGNGASKRRAFEDEVDREMNMTKQSSPATCVFAPLSPDLEVHDRSDLQISEPKVRQESLAYLFERCIELIRGHGRDDS
jgi:hypothetical protein